ncbi:MAG: hypothetical protein R2712_11535 [Vicinamibacterales bacterium]
MAVLAAVREGEPRRVREARRGAVHHLRDEGQRLQRPRPELLHQQQRREVPELAFIRQRQHRSQSRGIDIGRPHVVVRGQHKPPRLGQRPPGVGARNGQHRVLAADAWRSTRLVMRLACPPTMAACGSSVNARTAAERQ